MNSQQAAMRGASCGSRGFCHARRSGCLFSRRQGLRCTANLQPSEGTAYQRWQAGLHTSLAKVSSKVFAVGIGAALAVATLHTAWPADAQTAEQQLFLEAWRAVDRAYVDKSFNRQNWFALRERMLHEAPMASRGETYDAIRALLRCLDDPFTRLLEPPRLAALRRASAGALTGVGLEVAFVEGAGAEGELVVVTPAAGGPADRAAIQPRDALLSVNGRPCRGMSLYEAGELLQGPEGTQVTLTIRPHDSDAPRDVALTREKVALSPVTSQICGGATPGVGAPEGKLGYLRLATFSKTSAEAVRQAVREMRAAGVRSYVLDVRNNGGGLFPAGVDLARAWLPGGGIVLIADSSGVRDSYEAEPAGALEPTAPLALLVNRGTASASEVLAGSLQDHGRATVVGERTFGKGLIQTIVDLSDGSGVAVTIARYQTPAGRDIQGKGIIPDIQLAPEQLPPAGGPAFCKAIQADDAPQLFLESPPVRIETYQTASNSTTT